MIRSICQFFGETIGFLEPHASHSHLEKLEEKEIQEKWSNCQKSGKFWPSNLIFSPLIRPTLVCRIPRRLRNNPHHLHHNPHQTHFQHSVCGVVCRITKFAIKVKIPKSSMRLGGQTGTDCVPAGNPCSLSQTAKVYTQCSLAPRKQQQICSLL